MLYSSNAVLGAFIASSAMALAACSSPRPQNASVASPPSYTDQTDWRKIQAFLPEGMQLDDADLPSPGVWPWRGHEIYVERFENRESPVKLILLHGVGTNGRQMSLLVGSPMARRGLASVSLDLPGYGVSRLNPNGKVSYSDWVQLVSDFVDAESARDPRPIVLYGLSAGGMLTYHVAAMNPKVTGIVGMDFLDQRDQRVRDGTAHDWFMSRVGVPMASILSLTPIGNIKMSMQMTSKMWALANDPEAMKAFLADRSSAGNSMPMRFLADYMTYEPAVEPEEFTTCPVLLTQPAADRWTPLPLSEIFIKRFKKVPVKVVMLENAGHFPLEQPGIDQLHDAIFSFAQSVAAAHPMRDVPSAL